VNHTPPASGHTVPSQAAQDAALRLVAFLDGFCAFIAAHLLGRLFLAPFLNPLRARLRAASGQFLRLGGQGDAAPAAAQAPVPRLALSCHAVQPPRATRATIRRQQTTAARASAAPGCFAQPGPTPDLHLVPDRRHCPALRAKPARSGTPLHAQFVTI
jgi:hypothetical protein